MMLNPIDHIPLWLYFVIVAAFLFLAAEAGFSLGKPQQQVARDKEEKQTGTIMGASLGLLAFMLAFSFGMATTIHGERKALVLEESNAIGTAWLRAQFIPEPLRAQVKASLQEYVDIRIKGANWETEEELRKAITRSEDLLDQIWDLTVQLVESTPASIVDGLFIESINEMIDLHSKRVNAGFLRIPRIVNAILFFIAIVTLAMMGYQSGLNAVRTLVPRIALILAFTSVMLLITDLDRPGNDLVSVKQKTMLDLQAAMTKGG